MLANTRQNEICKIIKEKSAVTTAMLSEKFGVSVETIRKDLLFLEKRGELVRVHGGAIAKPSAVSYQSFNERVDSFREQKSEVGKIAAEFVKNGDTIAIDAGSTAIEFIDALKERLDTLTVVTYSMDVFERARDYKNFNVILCGGFFMKSENTFYGEFALEMLDKIHVGKSFVFPSGISLSNGLCDCLPQFVDMQRKLISVCDRVFVVADSSKYEKCSLIKSAETSPRYTYITDSKIPAEITEIYKGNGITLVTSTKQAKTIRAEEN